MVEKQIPWLRSYLSGQLLQINCKNNSWKDDRWCRTNDDVMMNSALGRINATSESGKSLRGICAVSCGEDEACCGDYCFPGINVCCPIRNYACKPGYTCCGFFCCKSALAYCCSPNNCCAYETPNNSPTFFPTQPPYQRHPYPTYGPVW